MEMMVWQWTWPCQIGLFEISVLVFPLDKMKMEVFKKRKMKAIFACSQDKSSHRTLSSPESCASSPNSVLKRRKKKPKSTILSIASYKKAFIYFLSKPFNVIHAEGIESERETRTFSTG